ncbi:MAG: AAA family ATPase [Gracilimonas sp.]|uniref:AAA family ATPase n=1 Tax=Gracilimonas sp. TaxID=1974203 RepID=UPI003752B1B4|nr:AAA family ATPase [Gracilimonas sp.]
MSETIIITKASDLLGKKIPELKYNIQHLVVPGLTLIAAAPKVGKSYLMLYLAYYVATGQNVFAKLNTRKSKVLYLALEDNPRRLKKRLEEITQSSLLGSVNIPENLDLVTSLGKSEDYISTIKKLIAKHNYEMVIVDILQRIAKPEETGSYNKDYTLAKKLKELADATGTSILAVHHTNKKSSKNTLDAISGTRGLVGACDNIMVLSRTSEDSASSRRGTLKMEIQGRDLDSNCFYLEYGTSDGFYTLSEKEPIRESKAEKMNQAWKLQKEGFKQHEIAKLMGDITQGYVSKLLKEKKEQLAQENGQDGTNNNEN